MNKIVCVALREFVDTVRSRTFLFSSVFLPMLIVGVMFGGEWIAKVAEKDSLPLRKVALADLAGGVLDPMREQIAAHNQQSPLRPFELVEASGAQADSEALRKRIADGELYAYAIVPPEAVDADAPAEMATRDGQLQWQRRLQDMLERAVVAARFERADPPVNPQQVYFIQRPLAFRSVDAGSGQETTGNELVRFMTPFAFMFFLFMGTMNISQGLLTSLIEEKSSRVIEVLLSAVSPTQLMAGKILGMVSVGTLLMAIWAGVGWYGADSRGMGYLVQPYQIVYLALYFVPGFLLTAALLAAVGSACNSLKDAQSLAFPITLVTIIPMMLWWQITMNPNSVFSIALSYVPPITPFIMILRICSDPQTPIFQIVTTLLLLWIAVFVAIWASGRIFRVGVLMYGKPPTPAEMLRWIARA